MVTDRETREAAYILFMAAVDSDSEADWEAYDKFEAPALEIGDNDMPLRCAATGAPIWDADEYVVDQTTGEAWIRSEIGLPPRETSEGA